MTDTPPAPEAGKARAMEIILSDIDAVKRQAEPHVDFDEMTATLVDAINDALAIVSTLEARATAAEGERDAMRGIANQALDTIQSVQDYEQPNDPTHENALTMEEHEVFDFDVPAARAALSGDTQP